MTAVLRSGISAVERSAIGSLLPRTLRGFLAHFPRVCFVFSLQRSPHL
jgi:hypothetical protein